jgi:hypothetical protein
VILEVNKDMCEVRVLLFVGAVSVYCCLGLATAEGASRIDCGAIKVGQERNIRIPIRNETKERMCVEKVVTCCGNPKATISDTELDPGETAQLAQQVKRKRPGPFEINIGVLLKGPEKRSIKYTVFGNAHQSVKVLAGWAGMPLQSVDHMQKEVRLPVIHQEGSALDLCLSSRGEESDVRDALTGITSEYFRLEPNSIEGSALPAKVDADNGASMVATERTAPHREEDGDRTVCTLRCRLAAKGPLPIGELTDTVVASFRDGSECYIPLVFRAVGDVFVDASVLGFGKVTRGGPTDKTIQIHFTHGVRPWTNVRWNAEGRLANAVDVVLVQTEATDEGIRLLRISIDGERIPDDARGFVSCRLELRDDTDQTKVPLLVYGYL